jgi:hypothetical protein
MLDTYDDFKLDKGFSKLHLKSHIIIPIRFVNGLFISFAEY